MKGYDLKNNILNPNRLKDKNSKNRENASSSSKKNRLSPDKRNVKINNFNENKLKKSIFSQLGNNIVHNNETSNFEILKDISNKNNCENELIKNDLNFSADKNDLGKYFNPLAKLRNSSTNYSNIKVQSYLSSNKSNNMNNYGIEDILLNGNNIVPLNHVMNNSSIESIKYKIDEDQLIKYISISDIWLDLFNNIDSKQALSVLSRRYLSNLRDETQDINFNFEIFNNANLNKAYSRACKLSLILIIFNKFIISDFQFDNNLKSSLKKLFLSISEVFINILEIYIVSPLLNHNKEVKIETQEKISKFTKSYKINKKVYPIELCNLFLKMTDGCINNFKLFSNNNFKMGFFKPINNIISDLIRNLDKVSINQLVTLIVDNILYGFLILHLQSTVLSNKQLMINPPSYNSLFQTPSIPFLPTIQEASYTLVLDLDETLVHFFYTPSGGSFLIRPKALEFLNTLYTMYEICIFTAAMKDYADSILDIIDKDYKLIKYRLYRNHTSIVGNGFVKVISLLNRDISKLGRDLSKVIIIDNLAENFRLQINNGLAIRTWNDDMKDSQLVDLMKILQDIHSMRIPDVRVIIKKIKEDLSKTKNTLNPYTNIEISKLI